MTGHQSDSSEQLSAEREIIERLQEELDCRFVADATLGTSLPVQPDAIDPEAKIVVEIYARVGRLKGAQFHKVKGDLLKLALIGHLLGPEWRKIICFASDEAAHFLKGSSWAAKAASEFGIEIRVISLPGELEEIVVSAQKRQKMINEM